MMDYGFYRIKTEETEGAGGGGKAGFGSSSRQDRNCFLLGSVSCGLRKRGSRGFNFESILLKQNKQNK